MMRLQHQAVFAQGPTIIDLLRLDAMQQQCHVISLRLYAGYSKLDS
jgi:hypothetical protein